MLTLRSFPTKSFRHEAKRALKQAGRRPVYPLECQAQFGEDALIATLSGGRLDGFFVEAGAFDGYHASVTYALECIGWRGLLVEANPGRAAECLTRRPNSRVVHAALGNTMGETNFIITDDPSGGMYSHVLDPAGPMKRKTLTHSAQVKVPLTTLNALLADHRGGGDAVALDVEGFEVPVLDGFDLRRYQPRVLLLEDNPRRPNDALVAWMSALPYTQVAWLRVNRVYVHSDFATQAIERLEAATA